MSNYEFYLFNWEFSDPQMGLDKKDCRVERQMLICLKKLNNDESFETRFGRYVKENIEDFEELISFFQTGIIVYYREDFPVGLQIQLEENWNGIMEFEELTEKLENMMDEEVTQLLTEEYLIDGFGCGGDCSYSGTISKVEEVIKIDD